MVEVKSWLVVGGGDKIEADHGWWRRIHTCSWVVVGVSGKNMADRGWSWMVVDGRGLSWLPALLVMPV